MLHTIIKFQILHTILKFLSLTLILIINFFQSKPGKKLAVEEEKRILGLVLLRGDKIISMSVDGPPQKNEDDLKMPKAGGLSGPGQAKAAPRAVPVIPQQQMPGN